IRRILTRYKNDALAVGSPIDDLIKDAHAVAERSGAALVERELLGLAAIGRHHIDVKVAVVLAGEGNPLSVRGEFREELASGMRSNAPRCAAGSRRQPQIA